MHRLYSWLIWEEESATPLKQTPAQGRRRFRSAAEKNSSGGGTSKCFSATDIGMKANTTGRRARRSERSG